MGTNTMLRIIAAVASLASTAALAQRVDVTLEDRTLNRSIDLHQFDGRWYAGGEPGHRYAIRLTNRTGERLLAVVSVDGVNVVSGQTAAPHQSGYVLDPWQSTVVNGWRKDMSQIAAFTFAPLPESYAARTGRPDDVGVIGVAVFEERRVIYQQPPVLSEREDRYSDRDRRSGAAGATQSRAPSAQSTPAPGYNEGMATDKSRSMDSPLGTGHGEREWSSARSTQFVRASSSPSEVNAVWYDSRRNLMAAGIIPDPQRRHADRGDSRPFPGFVPDPW